MTFDGVRRDHGATGVPAPSRQKRTPAAGERSRGRKKKRTRWQGFYSACRRARAPAAPKTRASRPAN